MNHAMSVDPITDDVYALCDIQGWGKFLHLTGTDWIQEDTGGQVVMADIAFGGTTGYFVTGNSLMEKQRP